MTGGRGAAAVVAALVATVAVAATALAVPANPSADIPLGALPAACEQAPAGATCERAAIAALDHAHRALGLAAYVLPKGFIAMPAPQQWLLLANADRAAYGIEPIAGIAKPLNVVARQGAAARADPDPWTLLRSLSGQRLIGFSSDWAGGQPNALVAYYGWMYDDGYGSGNLDCRAPSDPGCWGHRRNILAFAGAPALTMGAAALTQARSYALTIVETSTPPWPYAYRAQA